MIRLVLMGGRKWIGTEIDNLVDDVDNIEAFVGSSEIVLLVDHEDDIPDDMDYEIVERKT